MQRGPTPGVNRLAHSTGAVVGACIGAFALVATGGCDAVVVLIDHGGDDVAGGGAAPSVQGTGGYDGAGAGPSGTVHDACKRLCLAAPSCDAQLGCVEDCEAAAPPGCDATYGALLDCESQVGVGPGCSVLAGTCEDEVWALKWCRNPSLCVTDGACTSDGTSCACEGSCDEGALRFSTSCSPYSSGYLCECSLGEVFIGDCTVSTLDCSVEGGCCEALYR